MSIFFVLQIGFVLISCIIIVYLLFNRMGDNNKGKHDRQEI